MKQFLSSAALAAAVVTLALAVPAAPSPAEEVVVGVVHWEGFAYAGMMRRSYEMALADIEGAAGGRTLRLVFADDGGERRDGEAAVERLVRQEGAALLIGGYSSSNTLYTAMAADRMGVPFLVTTAADDRSNGTMAQGGPRFAEDDCTGDPFFLPAAACPYNVFYPSARKLRGVAD